MNRREFLKISVMAGVGLTLGGGKVPAASDPLTFRLDWIKKAQYGGVVMAEHLGFYKEAGIEAEVKAWEYGVDVGEELTSGKADVICDTGDSVILNVAAGKPIKAIGSMFQFSPFGWFSLKEKKIKTLKDALGKRIGVKEKVGEYAVKIMLFSIGKTLDDVDLVYVEPSDFGSEEALIKDQVDLMEGYFIDEPVDIELKGIDLNVIRALDYGYDFYGQVICTTEEMIQTQPALLTKFLDATIKGWKYAVENPAHTAKVIVENHQKDYSLAYQLGSMRLLKPLVGDKPCMMNSKFWKKSIDLMIKFGIIEEQLVNKKVHLDRIIPENIHTLKILGKTHA